MDQYKETSLEEIRKWMDQSEEMDPINEVNQYAERLDFIQEQLRLLEYDSKEEIEVLFPRLQKLADDHQIPKSTFIKRVLNILSR